MGLLAIFGGIERRFPGYLSGIASLGVTPLRIVGSVRDAATGKEITEFTVTPGSPFGAGTFAWADPNQSDHYRATSHFEQVFRRPLTIVTSSNGTLADVVLKISAPGYAAAVTDPVLQTSGRYVRNVELRKASSMSGVILTPDGRPLLNSKIFIIDSLQMKSVSLANRTVADSNRSYVTTGVDGSFRYDRPIGPYSLLAADPAGFLVVGSDQLPNAGRLMLKAWAQVKVKWLNGSMPAKPQWLGLKVAGPLSLSLWVPVPKPDDNGEFSVPAVPPGRFTIYWTAAGEQKFEEIPLLSDELDPGESKMLQRSTQFRSIQGRIATLAGNHAIDFSECRVVLSPVAPILSRFRGAPATADTPEKRDAWWAEWRASAEGRASAEIEADRRSMQVAADGSFASRWIAPGTYDLTGYWTEGSRTIARLGNQQVQIPSGGDIFPLGIFEMQLSEEHYLAVGDRVPDFEAKDFAGRPIALADVKGKFLLLDFWATDCPPCIAEIPNLRAVYEKFHGSPQFAMIGMNMDSELRTASRLVEASHMSWPEAHFPRGWVDPIVRSYGVRAIPTIFLIDPEGRVIARDLRGEEILAMLETKLSQ